MSMMLVCLLGTGLTLSNHVDKPAREQKMRQVVYSVADLLFVDYDEAGLPFPRQDNDSGCSSEDQLIQVLMTKIAPDSWAPAGGPGVIQYFPLGMSLVVNQSDEVHAEIQKVLAQFSRRVEVVGLVKQCYRLMGEGKWVDALAVARKADKLGCDKVDGGAVHIPTICIEERLRLGLEEKLAKPVSIALKDVPLRLALANVRMLGGINISVDEVALEQASVSLDQPLLFCVERISLRSALNLMLKQIGLTYQIKDGALLVTVPTCGKNLPAREYPIAESMVPGCEHLIAFIKSTIFPDSWGDDYDRGPSIRYCPKSKSLIVRQTQDVQEAVEALMKALGGDQPKPPMTNDVSLPPIPRF